MVKILVSLLLVIALACGLGPPAPAAEPPSVQLHVEPDPPLPDQSFSLVFEARGDIDADPDFKPLEADFDILGRNQQTSLEIINGRRSRSTVWSLNVLPRHGAPLTVPAVKFGKYATAPRKIEFATAGITQATDDGLFLEVDAEPLRPYVQQQVIYRLRLWRRYEISNASLSEPALTADAIVKPIDADRRYEETRDGKRYEIIERRFAIFPMTSGPVTIKPATVTAQVVKRGFSLFDNFSQPVATRRVVSDAVELDVRPVPKAFPQGKPWLPAKQLSLNEEWQPAGATAKVGEPVTRTLNLWADGLTAGQLPPLDGPDIQGLKQYPDRPQSSEQQQESGYSAVLQRKTAIIPTTAGDIALPAIEIPWWNTRTDALEIARVPPSVLHSEAVPGLTATPPATVTPPAATTAPSTTPLPVPAPTTRAPSSSYWPVLALLSSVGWLLTLVLWWRRPSPALPAATPARGDTAGDAARLHALEQAVERALTGQDAPAMAAALLRWAAARWPDSPPRSLGALAARVSPEFATQLWVLDSALYRPGATAPSATSLREAWRASLRASTAVRAERSRALPPLYPSPR